MDRRPWIAALAVATTLMFQFAHTQVSAASDSGGVVAPSASSPVAVAGPSASSRRQTPVVTARYRHALRTSSLAEVNAAYRAQFAPYLSQSTGYLGLPRDCQVGRQSAASRNGTLSALNFVRSLGGLAPVRFNAGLNKRAQATAMLMSANQQLSHYPSQSWRCWNTVGASNAAKANLALSWPSITSGRAISLYMQEPGNNNKAVGHRRWLMNPETTQMGSGATDTASAITVIGPTARSRPNPAYIGWPTAGFFPNPLEPAGRWSLSSGDPRMRFGSAKVKVHRAVRGAWVRVRAVKHRVHTGYARPTIVFQVANVDPNSTYRVSVTGIRKPGTKKAFKHRYTVNLFTPR